MIIDSSIIVETFDVEHQRATQYPQRRDLTLEKLYKFGGDQLTAYVYYKSLDGAFFDEELSDDNDFYGLVGKRIYHEDSQGFSYLWKYDTADNARLTFEAMVEQCLKEDEHPDKYVRHYDGVQHEC